MSEQFINKAFDFIMNGELSNFKKLLNDKNLKIENNEQIILSYASTHGAYDFVELLLEDSRFDPSYADNMPISYANSNGHLNIVALLLQHPKVKNSLQRNHEKLYNKLQQEVFSNNIDNF